MQSTQLLKRPTQFAILSMLGCLLLLTPPALHANLTINESLIIGTDPDPNGLDWDYTDRTITIGSGAGETGTLTVPAGQTVKYYDLLLGVGDTSAEGSLIIDGTNAAVESSRTGTAGSLMVVGRDGIGNLTIQNGGRLTRRGLTIGENAGSVGSVSITGADSLMESFGNWMLLVGNDGTGTFTADEGAIITGVSFFRVADGAGGAGSASILGGATLTATEDGRIGFGDGSVGTVTVSGENSALAIGRDFFIGQAGEATLNIADGGAVTVDRYTRVGRENGSVGTINVSGENSTLTHGNFLHLGATGDGHLNVTDGGIVNVNANFTAGGITSSDTDAEGHIVVDGIGSSLSASGFIWVGRYGGGSMLVENGGAVTSMDSLRIGRETSGSGSVTVRGENSSINLMDSQNGFFWAGDSGQGEFLIEDGGSVYAEGTVRLGVSSGSQGSGIVRGAGSSLVSDTWFRIADEGNGTLLIEDGATVESAGIVSISFDPAAEGNVIVTGEDSLFKSGGFFRVGRRGPGSLFVSDGGKVEVTSGDFTVGSESTGEGMASFTGMGTVLEVTDEIVVGDLGTGSLILSDGAAASTLSDFFIGAGATGNGVVTAEGSETTLDIAENLMIGADFDEFDNAMATGGSGMLGVENGATVTVGGDFILRGENRLHMNGGNLSILGDLDLADVAAELFFTLGSAGFTGLSAGNVFLNDTRLEIELTYQPLLGDVITLIEVDASGSILGNLIYDGTVLFQDSIFEVSSNGFEQHFQISYAGSNDLTLTAIPEPSTWGLLLGAGLLGLILWHRRR